ncbi:MAG: ParA family protein [Acidimicrobiaceae bacterium]|nr:ParA family protein [Acidimicrobiaceae bacterium]MYH00004.1 ParA family protein [Acidimicrobiaceae bacterium]MYL05139.1 ParA family protein [Acidimicrobiaceae bacterium]
MEGTSARSGARPRLERVRVATVQDVAVIALVNQKGGVGKTTTALGLASAAWVRRIPSVVVDLDPQGNATTGLGVWEPAATVDEALESDRPGILENLAEPSGWPEDKGLPPRIVPSTPALAGRERQMLSDPVGAQDRLRVALSGQQSLVLIDCPPSLGLLTINALFAADAALVVTEPSAWASDGVSEILRTIDRVDTRKPAGLAVAGVAVNRLARTRDSRYWHEQLVTDHGRLVLPPVRLRAAVTEAAARSMPIHALPPRRGAAEACTEFDEIYDRVVGEQRPEDPDGL